jgi:hypothetical protein
MGSQRVKQVEEYRAPASRLPERVALRDLAARSGGPAIADQGDPPSPGIGENFASALTGVAEGGNALLNAAPGDAKENEREEKEEYPLGVVLNRADNKPKGKAGA